MKKLLKTDVVIVGLGAAGGIAANVLTKAGLKVVGLEAGPYLTSKDFMKGLDEISGFGMRNHLGATKFNHEIPTWRTDAAGKATPSPIALRMTNAVGGTSLQYAAMTWRLRADDFKIRSTTIKRYGESAFPADSALVDWPVSYEELEPYYTRVEHSIGVSGAGGANPFESKRSKDYPMPPIMQPGYSKMLETGMKELGYHPFPPPAAINSVSYGGRPACTYCGFCSGFACWNDSKSSTLVTSIHEAEASGKLEVRPLSTVTRILTNDNGQTTGVEYRTADGELVEQPAGVVILSSYVYENVRRLLLSKSDYFPNGLSNNHGQVGKYFMTHTFVLLNALFPGKAVNTWGGALAQSTAIDDLNGDNFDHTGLGFIRGALVSGFNGNLPIQAANALPPGVPNWGQGYKDWLKESANSVGNIVAQLETLPYHSNFLDLDPEFKDPKGEPVVRITYNIQDNEKRAGEFMTGKLTEILKKMGASKTWFWLPPIPLPVSTHAFGGARMGDDPATSVVDKYCMSHEVPNLAVLGGATFCSASGYNPTGTIQALSWRAAEHVAQNFSKLAV